MNALLDSFGLLCSVKVDLVFSGKWSTIFFTKYFSISSSKALIPFFIHNIITKSLIITQ